MPRINHHKQIIDGIRYNLDTRFLTQEPYLSPMIVEMHTTSMRRMPSNLKGVPDLIVSTPYRTTYVEIKPLYKKSRDRLNDAQCRFAVEIYPIVTRVTRYWIVQDAQEFEQLYDHAVNWYVPAFHERRIVQWCETRGVEIPW